MATLGGILGLVAARLPFAHKGVATGGSTTTLIDTVMPAYADDYWNGGTLILTGGTLEGKTASVTDFVSSTRTVTVGTQTATIDAGDTYILLTSMTSRGELVDAVNNALKHIGAYTQTNETLTTVANQSQYNLPTGVSNVKRVEIAGSLSEPYDFDYDFTWQEVGTKLEFSTPPGVSGYTMRIWYDQPHATVTADSDTISGKIDQDRVAWTAVYYALLFLSSKETSANDRIVELMKVAQSMTEKLAVERPTTRISGSPRYARL